MNAAGAAALIGSRRAAWQRHRAGQGQARKRRVVRKNQNCYAKTLGNKYRPGHQSAAAHAAS